MTSLDTHADILSIMLKTSASWAQLTSYDPAVAGKPESDTHLDQRAHALLQLHAHQQTTPLEADGDELRLALYLLDQEIRYHQQADHYRASISLAAYIVACFCRPRDIWPIWAARECNYDTSKLVDSHYLYHTAGGLEKAREYVSQLTDSREVTGDVIGAGGVKVWWEGVLEDNDGDGGVALQRLKKDVLERIAHDERCGVSDEVVEKFVLRSWRVENERWAESLIA
ncbi:hypothetical protein BD779DRAFT_1078939 [Infundibulicybe gibba]|nr:hypothetical protein BD779DRAFT_1078939 [Infundibulicybe gibba]